MKEFMYEFKLGGTALMFASTTPRENNTVMISVNHAVALTGQTKKDGDGWCVSFQKIGKSGDRIGPINGPHHTDHFSTENLAIEELIKTATGIYGRLVGQIIADQIFQK